MAISYAIFYAPREESVTLEDSLEILDLFGWKRLKIWSWINGLNP